ncbi:MAG: sigma-70 family RNA polymerase sigma factor [Nannocystaceae bacterium]|nr:sigma-70 family RNA polymerase sigma factor [Nannocystaceae bacterium]
MSERDDEITAAFVASLRPPLRVEPGERAELARALADAIALGVGAWPELSLPPATFAAWLGARLGDEPGVLEQLGRLAIADLWLACACGLGDSRAIAAFERRYAPEIRGAVARLRDQLPPDEFRQLLRARLFVGDGDGGGAITRYSGRGNLGAWVRVTAMRTALNATRNRPRLDRPAADDDDLFEFAPSPDDPELDHLERSYRAAFRQAFLDTVATLPASERTLLRQSVVHGLTVRELAKVHGVHHATIARRIASARERLVEGTRAVLASRLALAPGELDSIMMMIRSRLDVSISRALAGP